jgi:hypothetical protein
MKQAEINDSISWTAKQAGLQNPIQFDPIQEIQTGPKVIDLHFGTE